MLKAAPGTFAGSYEDIGCVLQELCTSELDGFPTSLEEDEFDLRNCENSRMRTAIQYRMSKKKILLKKVNYYDLCLKKHPKAIVTPVNGADNWLSALVTGVDKQLSALVETYHNHL
eukprot:IDg3701t1